MNEFAEYLKKEIEQNRITKSELSRLANVSRPVIDKVLDGGKVHLRIYEQLAEIIGVEIHFQVKRKK